MLMINLADGLTEGDRVESAQTRESRVIPVN